MARLSQENEQLRAVPARDRGMARTRWALALVVLASVLFSVAIPALWLNRVVTSTDAWVETVGPLASDPAIQDAFAASASSALIEQLDATSRLQSVLPASLAPLAPVIATSVEGFVREQATAVVRSPKFEEIWIEVNRTGHKLLIAGLTGKSDGAVTVEAGTIALDVGTLSSTIQQALLDRGLTFLERVPLDRLDTTIEHYSSPALAQASTALAAMSAVALWLPVILLGLVAAAFGLATDRRRVALWLGAGIVIVTVLPLQGLYLSQYWVTQQVQALGTLPGEAAQSAYSIIFRGLFAAERISAVLGIIIWLAALVAGPSRWAVALRNGMQGGLGGVASHLETGAFGIWVQARKAALRVTGFALATVLLLALPAPRTIASVLWIAVLVVGWLVIVEVVGASVAEAPTDEEPAPTDAA